MLIPLLKNSLYCEHCKTEIVSKFNWDKVYCKCKNLQKQISTDGGSNPIHWTSFGDKSKYKNTSVIDDGKLETRLKYLTWGSYGKTGKDKLKIKLLSELTDEHLCAILNTQKDISDIYRQTIEDLIILREQTNTIK